MTDDRAFWNGRRVAITGHTGFKGAWLAHWLAHLGSRVSGFALPPATNPNLFDVFALAQRMDHVQGDIRDADAVAGFFRSREPEIVFHLASEALVRRSYALPALTFDVNVMGLVQVLEALRATSAVRAAVIVTSDKCYENADAGVAFREDAKLGGRDPYSSSKACAEIVTTAYRASYFSHAGAAAIATARAGNVIGGGDWSEDRLIPDIVRAAAQHRGARLRRPEAVRPWQHVFEPIAGYLRLAQALATDGTRFAGAWNFGPDEQDVRTVADVASRFIATFGAPPWKRDGEPGVHEASLLRIDAAKARRELGWQPRFDIERAVDLSAQWYRAFSSGESMREISDRQLRAYAA